VWGVANTVSNELGAAGELAEGISDRKATKVIGLLPFMLPSVAR
jgi:hypothetical protein